MHSEQNKSIKNKYISAIAVYIETSDFGGINAVEVISDESKAPTSAGKRTDSFRGCVCLFRQDFPLSKRFGENIPTKAFLLL